MVRVVDTPAPAVAGTITESRVLMRGLVFSASIPRYVVARVLGKRYPTRALPLRLVTMPEPERRNGFERLKVRLSGICGSDLALLYGKNTPALSPMFSFPAVLGHEILAELGGVRVAVNPVLACLERGLPDCPACARGEDQLCQNVAEGNLAAGMIGFCSDLPGGWGQRMLAHRERIFPVPEGVPDERAVLTEPMAVALHGIRMALAKDWPGDLLVVGAGSIGLLTIRLLRVMGYRGKLYSIARRKGPMELAKRFGADEVYPSVTAAQEAIGAKRYRGLLGAKAWRGGFGAVIEASGSPQALQDASWAVREGGRVLLLGAPGLTLHDFSPYWFGEIKLFGSYTYSWDDFAQTVQMLPEVAGVEALVTHQFSLEAWPEATRTAVSRKGMKVVFKP